MALPARVSEGIFLVFFLYIKFCSLGCYLIRLFQALEKKKGGVLKFALVWNQIISSFRDEDLISNRLNMAHQVFSFVLFF